ncbi:hypothetical protein [Alteromonas flava]|uniref:hypothetical protein n=1 Tax=Alteromonas flava TaxID=2048003 RepID=UPI000C28B8D2|nr:hypothetical protein [Alteromonas flava]
MNKTLQWIKAWLIAGLVTFCLASFAHSQFVLIELLLINVNIGVGDWLSMTFSDLFGLSLTYGVAIILSLFVAFLVLSLLKAKFNRLSLSLFVVGGGVTIAAMLLAMQPILDVTLIAGARTTLGFIAQCCAGLVGGWVFARIHFAKG